MLANQRREVILDMIKEDGHIKVAKLSTLLKVTEVTIRRIWKSLKMRVF